MLEKTVEDTEGSFNRTKPLAVLQKISSGSKSVQVSLPPEPELQRTTTAPLCCLCCRWLEREEETVCEITPKQLKLVLHTWSYWLGTHLLCVSSREPPCTPAHALQPSWQPPARWSSPPACFGGLKQEKVIISNGPQHSYCALLKNKTCMMYAIHA